MGDQGRNTTFNKIVDALYNVVDKPITWVRETVVKPNQKIYPYYHLRYRRVPTIDQCYEDDPCCFFEANEQFKRDRLVDDEILSILRNRYEDCVLYEAPDEVERCRAIWDTYKDVEANWFSKYGDLGYYGDVRDAYMKQKHRMIWERRHGKIGSGRKDKNNDEEL